MYDERASAFRELMLKSNKGEKLKWRNAEELGDYLESWGGRLKSDRRRRRGFLVSYIQGPKIGQKFEEIIVEVPMGFALKVLSMGGFP
jgi:hypothetical protein